MRADLQISRDHCGRLSRRVDQQRVGGGQPAEVRPASRSAGPRAPAAKLRPKSGRRICLAFRQGPYPVARTSPVPRAQPCWGERSRGKLHPSVARGPPKGLGGVAGDESRSGVSRGVTATPPWPPPPLLHVTYCSSFARVPAPPSGPRDLPATPELGAHFSSLFWGAGPGSRFLPRTAVWPPRWPHTSGRASLGKGLLARCGHFKLIAKY